MQPINNNQKYAAEYSALETAISLCGDDTLKAMMVAKLQGLAKQMSTQTQSSTPQPSFTASTAAAASPAITASASKVTNSAATSSSMDLETILKSNPEYRDAVKSWNVSSSEKISRLEEIRQYAFGTDKWESYFGQIVGEIPSLPKDIDAILNSSDAETHQKIMDSHLLVLVPRAVMINGKKTNISIESLGEIVKQPKAGGHKIQYSTDLSNPYEKQLYPFDEPVKAAHWVLMKKEILQNSLDKSTGHHEALVREYSRKTGIPYAMPNAVDVAACCLLTYVHSKTRLFALNRDDGKKQPYTVTRCQEAVTPAGLNFHKDNRLVLGQFSDDGLRIDWNGQEHWFIGVVAACKF